MDELVIWLKKQLNEDEAAAERTLSPELRVGRFRGKTIPHWRITKSGTGIIDEGGGTLRAQQIFPAEADHVIRHDPARVLREIGAKRRQVEWCVELIGDRDLSRYDEVGSLKDDKDALAVTLAVETLRLIAWPYDARPGYRAEWAPSE